MIKILKGKLVKGQIETNKSIGWIQKSILKKEILIVRGVFSNKKVLDVKNQVFKFGLKTKEKNPKRNVNTKAFHRIDINHKKMRVKRIAHMYRFSYKNFAQTKIFDLIKPLNIFRNKIANLSDKFSFFDEESGYVSQPAVLHYPAGGGYMQTHVDPLVPQAVEMVLTASERGSHFNEGGLNVKSKFGKWIDVEKKIKLGDIVMFRPDVPHKVNVIDGDGKIDWKNKKGRWTFFSPIANFKNQNLNEKSMK